MSIHTDDNDADNSLSEHDAVSQLMAKMKAPSTKQDEDEDIEDDEDEEVRENPEDLDAAEADEDEDEPEDDEEGDTGEDTPEDDASDAPAPPAEATDDAIVKVTVDGEETSFKVGDLKRLAGQEASLTRKSQEAELVGGRAAAALQGALESVLEDLEPYQDLDWVLEGQRMDPEEFAWHRETFNRLQARHNKLIGAAQDFEATHAASRETAQKERAAKAIAILSDPKDGIEGWNEALYNDILKYGVTQGLDPQDAGRITDAAVIKIIHKAMLYEKGKSAVAEKVKASPAKVRTGGSRAPAAEPTQAPRRNRATEKQIQSGNLSDRDAVKALLGRWGAKAS